MREYQVTIDGQEYHVRILDDPFMEIVRIEVNGKVIEVRASRLQNEAPAKSPQAAEPGLPDGPTRKSVQSPLPGIVKSVAVQAGQRVAAGDVLLVIEAMKMDNILRSPQAATVERIHVLAGQRVSHGQVLLDYSAQTSSEGSGSGQPAVSRV